MVTGAPPLYAFQTSAFMEVIAMDRDQAQYAIKRLRNVVMSLYRSAGNLDIILQGIELELDDTRTTELNAELFCRSKQLYRADVKKAAGFNDLDSEETEAWIKLLKAFSKKETES